MMSTSSKENTIEILEDIKRNLSRGVKDRKHNFHTPVFSNVNSDGEIVQEKLLEVRFVPLLPGVVPNKTKI